MIHMTLDGEVAAPPDTGDCLCDLHQAARRLGVSWEFLPLAYDADGYSQYGYDLYGFDRSGQTHLDRFGWDENGFDAGGRDRDGYDADGFDSDGYDREGYDSDGYDSEGYDSGGRNQHGINRDGEDRWGNTWCGECESAPCESWICDGCDDCHVGDLTGTLDDDNVCDRCLRNYYSWCGECDGYYRDEDGDDHTHEEDGMGCCESPAREFTIRNDGCDPLGNDTRVSVGLPAGTISQEGLNAIQRYLHRQGIYLYHADMAEIGDQWQAKTGNFAKRLSRHLYHRYQLKLSAEALSQVGCIARDHSTAASVDIEITRDLNRNSAWFCNSGSCWWGGYSESRCALKTNGGFALVSFSGGDRPSGRAWVMPLRKSDAGNLVPTFETMTPDAFVVFNGYGDLGGYAPARILSHMAGWTYRKINFGCSPMYVNAGGYLVAPEEIAEKYTDGELDLSVRQHSRLHSEEKELVNA